MKKKSFFRKKALAIPEGSAYLIPQTPELRCGKKFQTGDFCVILRSKPSRGTVEESRKQKEKKKQRVELGPAQSGKGVL